MVLHTITYLSEWQSLERIPPLIERDNWFWDSVTIEQDFGYKQWEKLAQAFADLPRSDIALSTGYVLQARRMGKFANVLGKNRDGSFALVVDNNIGWVSKDDAKVIDEYTKDLTAVTDQLRPWAFITRPVSGALIFFGFGKDQEIPPFEKDATN